MLQDLPARMLVSCGSLMIQTGAVPEAIHADGALVADVPQELSAVRLGQPAVAIALAQGETTATLMEKAFASHPELAELRQAILALGSVDLHDGLGSLASLGRVAGLVALEHDRLREHIERELLVPILRRRNGSLRRIAIWALNSLAGGVGAPTSGIFTRAAAEHVRLRTNAIIDVLSFQIGALTFLGLSDRIFDNAAAGLIEHLATINDPDRDPRESRQLVLGELPTVDRLGNEISDNRALRSKLALSLASAFAASEVQQSLQVGRTNRALGNSLRGVTVLRADWYGSVSREELVADAANNYLAELTTTEQNHDAAQPVLDFDEVRVSAERNTPEELSALALRARGAKPAGFENHTLAEMKFSVNIRIDGYSAEQVRDRAMETALGGRPGQALSELSGKQAGIERKIAECQVQESRQAARAETLRRRLRDSLAALFPKSRWAAGWQFVAGAHAAVKRFAGALNDWREAQEHHALTTARLAALHAAARSIGGAVQRIHALLARLRSALESFAGKRSSRGFTFAPLDEVSAGFLRCVAAGDMSLLRSRLASSAHEVTPDGLAWMIKSPSAQPADIVSRLLSQSEYSAPFWGGADPPNPPFFRGIVLPPIGALLLSSLREAALEAALRPSLLCGDTLAGGAAIVGIEAHELASIADVFPAPYLSGLCQIAGPKQLLYPVSDKARRLMTQLLTGEAVCA
jgi:hypothetical protein